MNMRLNKAKNQNCNHFRQKNMNTVKKIVIVISFLIPMISFSQEILTGVSSNPQIAKESKKYQKVRSSSAIKLPFFEDFSNYLGYPNPNLWEDRQVFVNNTFAVYPPTLGVATLDAIDENGRIYSHATNGQFSADTLTSLPIRLDSNFSFHRKMYLSDSIYLSFYFQPAGGSKNYPSDPWEKVGDTPEFHDKLVLELDILQVMLCLMDLFMANM